MDSSWVCSQPALEESKVLNVKLPPSTLSLDHREVKWRTEGDLRTEASRLKVQPFQTEGSGRSMGSVITANN